MKRWVGIKASRRRERAEVKGRMERRTDLGFLPYWAGGHGKLNVETCILRMPGQRGCGVQKSPRIHGRGPVLELIEKGRFPILNRD